MGHIGIGDLFGEQSALNDIPNPYSVVAATGKVEYYKIHRTNFNAYFNSGLGELVNEMRAHAICKNNWL